MLHVEPVMAAWGYLLVANITMRIFPTYSTSRENPDDQRSECTMRVSGQWLPLHPEHMVVEAYHSACLLLCCSQASAGMGQVSAKSSPVLMCCTAALACAARHLVPPYGVTSALLSVLALLFHCPYFAMLVASS